MISQNPAIPDARLLNLNAGLCNGRLTLTSGTAVTTSDVTGATSIYFTPYLGNRISLYDGANWKFYTFTERTLALGTLTASLPYDVFIYDNSGTLTMESLAWTNGTTRATALVLQDGVLSRTGSLTRRYLGTFFTTATTTTEDSASKRHVWNMYNRERRNLLANDATVSWTYTTDTWRQANGISANQVSVIAGQPTLVEANLQALSHSSDASNRFSAIGVGSTSSASGDTLGYRAGGSYADYGFATIKTFQPAGYQYYAWIERSTASGTTTWYGTSGAAYKSGIHGSIFN